MAEALDQGRYKKGQQVGRGGIPLGAILSAIYGGDPETTAATNATDAGIGIAADASDYGTLSPSELTGGMEATSMSAANDPNIDSNNFEDSILASPVDVQNTGGQRMQAVKFPQVKQPGAIKNLFSGGQAKQNATRMQNNINVLQAKADQAVNLENYKTQNAAREMQQRFQLEDKNASNKPWYDQAAKMGLPDKAAIIQQMAPANQADTLIKQNHLQRLQTDPVYAQSYDDAILADNQKQAALNNKLNVDSAAALGGAGDIPTYNSWQGPATRAKLNLGTQQDNIESALLGSNDGATAYGRSIYGKYALPQATVDEKLAKSADDNAKASKEPYLSVAKGDYAFNTQNPALSVFNRSPLENKPFDATQGPQQMMPNGTIADFVRKQPSAISNQNGNTQPSMLNGNTQMPIQQQQPPAIPQTFQFNTSLPASQQITPLPGQVQPGMTLQDLIRRSQLPRYNFR